MFSKTFKSKCSYSEVFITDQSSKPLEIEDKINITLVTKKKSQIIKHNAIFSSV